MVQLIAGPLGEEPTYRGFALPYMQREYGVVHAGLITGIVWGMWHLPLWIISGYQGLDLIIYCIAFMFTIVSCSVVMSVIYKTYKNIWYAFVFCFYQKGLIDYVCFSLCDNRIMLKNKGYNARIIMRGII